MSWHGSRWPNCSRSRANWRKPASSMRLWWPAPANETAELRLAKLLRQTNRLAEARTVLQSLPPEFQAHRWSSPPRWASWNSNRAIIREADRWLARARAEDPERGGTVVAEAVSSAVQEMPPRARELFAWLDAAHDFNTRMEDSLARVATGADDPQANDELRRLKASAPPKLEPGGEQTAARPAGGLGGDRRRAVRPALQRMPRRKRRWQRPRRAALVPQAPRPPDRQVPAGEHRQRGRFPGRPRSGHPARDAGHVDARL